MTKGKSIFITGIIAIMFAVIVVGAERLDPKVSEALMALTAMYGFVRGASDLCGWLQKEQTKEPEHLPKVEGDIWQTDDEKADYVKLFGSISEEAKH